MVQIVARALLVTVPPAMLLFLVLSCRYKGREAVCAVMTWVFLSLSWIVGGQEWGINPIKLVFLIPAVVFGIVLMLMTVGDESKGGRI